MKKTLLVSLMSVAILLTFVDCKHKTAKITELPYRCINDTVSMTLTPEEELNLHRCTEVLVDSMGLDSVYARKQCICLLNVSKEIDSTFMKMDPETRQKFIDKHSAEVIARCDKLVNF